MRRGIPKGAHLYVAPLWAASFGTFLAEARKVRITRLTNSGLVKSIRRAEDSDQSGIPNGVAITAAPKARIARGGIPAKFRFGKQLSLRYAQR